MSLRRIVGLLKTACAERPGLAAQLIEVDEPFLSRAIEECARDPGEAHMRYIDGLRHVLSWQDAAPGEAPIEFKRDGVYLITGGAGGLGLIFAKDIAVNAPGAMLMLCGRSSPARHC